MKLTSEEVVTKLLSSNEILKPKKNNSFETISTYNLGEFIEKMKKAPSPYDTKYLFIK